MPLGDYERLGELGRGAMGRVVRARHRATGAERAIKILARSDPTLLARFEREASALARAGGSGVVSIHEFGTSPEGVSFLVMDLMPGGSLRDRAKRGPLAWRDAVALALELARALERCHAAGLVHRDLKPDNVLFDEQGRARLADFGIVRDLAADALTRTGTFVGTPHYAAPEQIDGKHVDARADVFSLGAILYELIAGSPPHEGSSIVELRIAVGEERRDALAARVPGVPPELDRLLARALAPDPAQRTPSAAAFARALEALLEGRIAPRSRRRALAVAIVVVLASGGALAGLLLSSRGGSEPAPARLDPATTVALLRACAHADLAAGFPGRAVESAGRALAACSPGDRASLTLLRGRARLLAGDAKGALEDVREATSPEAARVRAQARRALEAWAEIVATSGQGDPEVEAIRAWARLQQEGDVAAARRALQRLGSAGAEWIPAVDAWAARAEAMALAREVKTRTDLHFLGDRAYQRSVAVVTQLARVWSTPGARHLDAQRDLLALESVLWLLDLGTSTFLAGRNWIVLKEDFILPAVDLAATIARDSPSLFVPFRVLRVRFFPDDYAAELPLLEKETLRPDLEYAVRDARLAHERNTNRSLATEQLLQLLERTCELEPHWTSETRGDDPRGPHEADAAVACLELADVQEERRAAWLDRAERHVANARSMNDTGRTVLARALLAFARERDPDLEEVASERDAGLRSPRVVLAERYRRRGRVEDALALLDKVDAVELHKDDSEAAYLKTGSQTVRKLIEARRPETREAAREWLTAREETLARVYPWLAREVRLAVRR